jgi:hypothetical protein
MRTDLELEAAALTLSHILKDQGDEHFAGVVTDVIKRWQFEREQKQWWVHTADIRGQQCRALSQWVEMMRTPVEQLLQSLDPAVIRAFVDRAVSLCT